MTFFKRLIRTFKINQMKDQKRTKEIRQFMAREQMRKNLLQERVAFTQMRNRY